MLYPVYVHMGDEQHAHSVTMPDFPGCFSAADDWDGLAKAVQEAIELYCEGENEPLPQPSSLADLQARGEYEDGVWVLVDVNVPRLQDARIREQHEALLADSGRIDRIGSWRLDVATSALAWSAETYRIVGVSPEAFTPSPEAYLEHVHPDDQQRVLEVRDRVLAGEVADDMEFRIRRPDGAERIVQEITTTERDANGRVVALAGTIQDVTERRLAEQRNEQYRRLLEASQDLFSIINREHRYVMMTEAYARAYGFDRAQAEGAELRALFDDAFLEQEVWPRIERCLAGEELRFEAERRHADGDRRDVLIHWFPLPDPVTGERVAGVSITDITAFQRAEAERDLLATVFHTSQALFITDATGAIKRVNDAFTSITGYTADEVAGANPRILASGKHDADFYAFMWRQIKEMDRWQGEIWNRRKNGEIYPEWESINVVRDEQGKVTHYLAVFHDITERKRLEAERERLATHDHLTGIYNRNKLDEMLQAAREANKRYDTPFSAVMFDVDHFKAVNDTYGHAAGDTVLRELMARVQGVLRQTDHLGRWGGEEFLILAGHTDRQGADLLAERIRQAVADEPFQGVGVVTVSLGVAEFQEGETLEHLQERVDKAMYGAKAKGRNRVVTD